MTVPPVANVADGSGKACVVGFEGPEKKLEVDFHRAPRGARHGGHVDSGSFRAVTRGEWDGVLADAQCTILSMVAGSHCDAYVLSESSLFVYDRKVMIKTCGTTTLLKAVPRLIAIAARLGLELDFLQYSRSAFMFPEQQVEPHTSFDAEVAYLRRHLGGGGECCVFGGDGTRAAAWHLFYFDNQVAPTRDQCFEVFMFDLEQRAMAYYTEAHPAHGGDTARCTQVCGVERLVRESSSDAALPQPAIDAHLFSPCGYSMNAVAGSAYYTMHVTPEPHCSFVSFECNLPLSDFTRLLGDVLGAFRPRRFVVSYVGDVASPAGQSPVDWRAPFLREYVPECGGAGHGGGVAAAAHGLRVQGRCNRWVAESRALARPVGCRGALSCHADGVSVTSASVSSSSCCHGGAECDADASWVSRARSGSSCCWNHGEAVAAEHTAAAAAASSDAVRQAGIKPAN